MSTFDFFVLGLATWRVSNMLVNEKGPWSLFVGIRKMAGIVHDENNLPAMIPDGFLPGVLSCVWCCSVWVSLLWVTFYFVFPVPAMLCGAIFGMSAVAILAAHYLAV